MGAKEVKVIDREGLYEALEGHQGTYGASARAFLIYLKDGNRPLTQTTVTAYVASLGEVKPDGTRLSASTFNTRVSALKGMLRGVMDNLPPAQAWRLEKFLASIETKKVDAAINENDYYSADEVKAVIEGCTDRTIALMVEFLWATGARVSEMLGILVSDVEPNHRNAKIRILGKRKRERFLMISRDLYDRIVEKFAGKVYLFEHNGRPFSRISVTNRIKYWSLKVVGKEFSAHKIRHAFANFHIKKNGYQKTSRYLGHSSTSTTLDLYGRESMSWEDLEDAKK